jgi:hypothetical protein
VGHPGGVDSVPAMACNRKKARTISATTKTQAMCLLVNGVGSAWAGFGTTQWASPGLELQLA